jgi:pantoate--beta-alanine ligase
MPADNSGVPDWVQQGAAARRWILAAQRNGQRVGLVPTMGALHAGHVSLVEASRRECDLTAVSIFVNPAQFGPLEDLDRYPRTLDEDLRKLTAAGADLVLAPSVEEMYPTGYSTYVDPPAVAARWEGEKRPGHFRGVATVVLKLFQLLPADVAYFGQKDYQQTLVVHRMVKDLNVATQIRVCPTVREADGLALSSRNQYLSAAERQRAAALYGSLLFAKERLEAGDDDPQVVAAAMRDRLMTAGFTAIDYVALVDPETLEPVSRLQPPLAILVAAWMGKTRLIDNLRVC